MAHESQHEYHDKNPMLHAYKKAEADILAELKKGIALIEGNNILGSEGYGNAKRLRIMRLLVAVCCGGPN